MSSPDEPVGAAQQGVEAALPTTLSDGEADLVAQPRGDTQAKDPRLWPPPTTVTATQTVADHLKLVEARDYDFAAFHELRHKLRDASMPICSYLRGLSERDIAAERDYFYRPGPFVHGNLSSKYGAISGCWNYVRMNDRRPDRELALVRELFPAERYECVSVGVMQPYLISDVLPCRSLSVVDFDWRVHDLHAQLIELAQRGEVKEAKDLLPALGQLTTSWLALRETTQAEQIVTMDDLCSNTMKQACERALLRFVGTSVGPADAAASANGRTGQGSGERTLEEIHLLLSSLHDAPYRAGPEEARFLFYFSNALEPMYTRASESQALRKNLQSLLVDGRRAVIIHHAGGREEFGIYEAWNEGASLSLRTLCKDPYPETRKGHTQTHYSIELDKGAGTGPSCKALMRELSAKPSSKLAP